MGLSEEEQKNSQSQRIQLNGQSNLERSTKNSTQAKDSSAHICGSHVEGSPCCQANIGLLCCQKSPSPENGENPELNEEAEKNKSLRKQISRRNSIKGASSRKACSLPSWFESWEREDTYATLAVIGAVLSVAFAYNCYKQMR